MKNLAEAKKHKGGKILEILLASEEREMKFEYFHRQFKYLITIKRINCGSNYVIRMRNELIVFVSLSENPNKGMRMFSDFVLKR